MKKFWFKEICQKIIQCIYIYSTDKCAAGYIHTSTGCKPCELNTYQANDHPLSTDTCMPCQPRFGLSTNTRSEGTDDPEKCLGKFV